MSVLVVLLGRQLSINALNRKQRTSFLFGIQPYPELWTAFEGRRKVRI